MRQIISRAVASDEVIDIFAAAGGANKAIARTFDTVASSTGQVVIAFTAGSIDNPKVDGLTVAEGTGTGSYTLRVDKAGTGTGTVSGGAISCGATCSATLASGAEAAVDMAAQAGVTFGGRDALRRIRAAGVKQVQTVNTWQRKEVVRAIRRAMAAARQGPAVVIAQGPCMRLPEMKLSERGVTPLFVDEALCTKCGACFKVWCPAITRTAQGFPMISGLECTACTVCAQVCPVDAIMPATSASVPLSNA